MTLGAFALLETRALRTRRGPTLSHVTRGHVRKSSVRRAAFVAGTAGFAAWVIHHIAFEE